MATFLGLKFVRVLRQCFLLVFVLFIYIELRRSNVNTWRFFKKAATSVDFRILVLTMNRAESLRTCLSHVNKLIVDDDGSITLDIWIDRAKDNSFDQATRRVATDFRWTAGPSSVHVQPRHAGVYGQWLDTWQPRLHGDNAEIALFVEDDVDVSPYAYRWLTKVHKFYAHRNDIAMFCLQDTNAVKMDRDGNEVEIERDATSPVFLYRIPGSWGCSPHPTHWRHFQSWFRTKTSTDSTFRPYVKEARLHSSWYKTFVANHRADSMWTMWFIYYCHQQRLFGLYSNLPRYTRLHNVSLSVNRKEAGMHFGSARRVTTAGDMLMQFWRDDFVKFPLDPPKYDYDGRRITH
ncbi:hypothetical protein NP493_1996g00027 [Ridgeia piscesae]|uniref:Uncharacterized protein n=1 Tax=Ridgeia piscesae TaxID=27915 RepID=A0AAD9JMZ0_RIDPI|nr:hypothetical protein NP493_1996g00027 [Ridgeia piscesae]